MTDKEFLNWIADRFVNVHGESENVDFVARLRVLAEKLDTNLDAFGQDRYDKGFLEGYKAGCLASRPIGERQESLW